MASLCTKGLNPTPCTIPEIVIFKILEVNKNNEYPQRFFEVGQCIDAEGNDSYKIAGVIARGKTNFSEIKSTALGMYEKIGLPQEVRALDHPSFISGRCAETKEGFYGEIHPQVLNNFELEQPVTALELNLEPLKQN